MAELKAKTTKQAGTIESAFKNMNDFGKGGKDGISGKKNKVTTNRKNTSRRLADSITAADAKYVSEMLAMYFYTTGKQQYSNSYMYL